MIPIMQMKREEMKKEFLALTPLERMRQMNAIFNEIISLKAKTKGVREYEIYRRYIEREKKFRNLLKSRKGQREREDKDQLI
jgi:hypothetical protein